MKIAIIGYAGQGQSSYEYWNTPENEITIRDSNPALKVPDGAFAQLGDDYLANLDRFDLVIRTPSLHPSSIVKANPNTANILDKVHSNTNEFFKVCPTQNIIGVTGTKGKGTTSTLITRMLEAAGKRVHLGGNIGIPPLELLKNDIKPDDWVVLELANFQLIDLKHAPGIAVVLMVEPEHLDWHEDEEEYIAAKQQMFMNQGDDDIAIYYAKNNLSQSVADASMGIQVPYMEKPGAVVENDNIVIDGQVVCRTNELKLLGKHNWQNVCAATTAVWQIVQDIEPIKHTALTFSGLPYRIELRKEIDGVRYYNDSFATGPGACKAAIEAIAEPKIMILGGFDRMLDLTNLAGVVSNPANNVKHALLIGASANRLAAELQKNGFKNFSHCQAKTMTEIVSVASGKAQSGDAIVLSPAFASFDMFKNFEDRGNKFNDAIESLA